MAITIEVRVTCPTCGGSGREAQNEAAGALTFRCVHCNGTGTVVDTDRSAALRKVVEWAARERRSRWCPDCLLWDAHADDCPYVLAKGVLSE